MIARVYLILSICFFFISCNNEEDKIPTNYESGIFIVNEGPFGTGTGTITFINEDEIIQDVYAKENDQKVLGNIAQSMIKMNGKYFIAVNNADKVQVVNANDFKEIGSVSPLSLPRYFASVGNKLYFTSWNKDFKNGGVNEIDPQNLKIKATVALSGLPEKMVAKDALLYVTISSTPRDLLSRHVIVLNTLTNTIVDTIEVGDNPDDIVMDKNGDIWVICSGFTNWSNFTLNTPGSLHKIRNSRSILSYGLPNGTNGLTIDSKGENLYYLSENKVTEININGQERTIAIGSFYALSYNKKTDELFLSDAGDFQGIGSISRLNLSDNSKSVFNAGIIPGFFYFSE